MTEKWTVLNNTAGLLNLPNNKITFRQRNQTVDLINLTGKTVAQLENDKEIQLNLNNGYLVTVEKVKFETEQVVEGGLLAKLDAIMKALLNRPVQEEKETPKIDAKDIVTGLKEEIREQISSLVKETVDKKNIVSDNENEEQQMRENALKKIIENMQDPEKKLDSFGKTRTVEQDDDFTNYVDF